MSVFVWNVLIIFLCLILCDVTFEFFKAFVLVCRGDEVSAFSFRIS